MLIIRSLLFNALFYALLIFWMVICLPCFVLPRICLVVMTRYWGLASLALLHVIAGVKSEFRGHNHIPPGGLLVASKHQSLWETFALYHCFSDPIFILKRELMWIPLFGWYLWKLDMISVHRKGGAKTLAKMNRDVHQRLQRGRQIIIFPEGTRMTPEAPPAYKFGVAYVYGNENVPMLPVALNSGLFWPRRKFLRYPGTIVAQFLPVIPPGMKRSRILKTLEEVIEPVTQQLIDEGRKSF